VKIRTKVIAVYFLCHPVDTCTHDLAIFVIHVGLYVFSVYGTKLTYVGLQSRGRADDFFYYSELNLPM